MKNTRLLLQLLLASTLGFTSCSDDDDNATKPQETPADIALEVVEFANLQATLETEPVRDRTTGRVTTPESGKYTKFDLEKGEVTTSEEDWDIAFRTTAIIVNGGENTGTNDEPNRTKDSGIAVVDGLFDEVVDAATVTLKQDSTQNGFAIEKSSGKGWYNYDRTTNVVNSIPGKVIVVKTSEGNYAKIEILSYYKNNPSEITNDVKTNDVRYYTFKYSVSANGSTILKNK